MPSDIVYGFVDANVLMHFQTFDEVDWPAKLGATHVHLVLAPSVMRELNKFKDDNTNERRKNRVRMLLAKLKPLLNAGDANSPALVRSGVTIFDIAREPAVDWATLGLDPAVEDDRLLASILAFAPAERARVLLISNDFPAQRKARTQQIAFWDPEGSIDRVELPSPEAARIKELEQKVQTLESRTPKVNFAFWEHGNATRVVTRPRGVIRPGSTSDADIERHLAQQRRSFEEQATNAGGRASEKDIREFRQEYDRYLKELKALADKSRARDYGWRYQFAFVLQNTGSAPLVDAEIALTFPSGSFVVGVSDEHDDWHGLGDLTPPEESVPGWCKPYNPLRTTTGIAAIHPTNFARQPEPRGPLYDDDRHRVYYEHPKLRHRETWYMEAVVAYLPPEIKGGFNIAYTLHADNLPRPTTDQLNVRLTQDGQ